MINLLSELIIIILIFGLISISLIGWGLTTVRILGLSAEHLLSGHLIFVGLSSVLFMTNVLHWFMPVNWLMSTIICIGGLCLAISLGRSQLKSGFSCIAKKIKKFPLMSLAGMLLILMYVTRVFEPTAHGDAGLYHIPTVSWLNQYPIIAGLGNLHFRLAFNQSYFSFVALLNIYPIWNHGYASANFYLFIITVFTTVQSIALFQQHKRLISILLLLIFANTLQAAISAAPDFTVLLFQINIFILSFHLFQAKINDKTKSLSHLVTLIILTITCITVKLSSLVFCFSILAISAIKYHQLFTYNKNILVRITAFCSAILLNHIAISYILSGYPLYPSSVGSSWSAPWGIPIESVKREQDWIYSWARLPDVSPQSVLQDWAWLEPWFHSLPAPVWLPITIAILLSCAQAIRYFFKTTVLHSTRPLYILYAPLFAALIFWFFTAPDARFIGAVPNLILFLSLYLFVSDLNVKGLILTRRFKLFLYALGILSLVPILMYALHLGTGLGLIQRLHLHTIIKAISDSGVNQGFITAAILTLLLTQYNKAGFKNKIGHLFSAGLGLIITSAWCLAIIGYMGLKLPLASTWAPIPSVETRVLSTESGLLLRVPVERDSCWLAPLPCTPYFDKSLKQEVIKVNNIIEVQNGFTSAHPKLPQ